MKPKHLLLAMLDSGREVARRKLHAAAAGEGNKTLAVMAVVCFEAAAATLVVNEPELAPPPRPARADEAPVVIRLAPPGPDVSFTTIPHRSEHGPN